MVYLLISRTQGQWFGLILSFSSLSCGTKLNQENLQSWVTDPIKMAQPKKLFHDLDFLLLFFFSFNKIHIFQLVFSVLYLVILLCIVKF